MFASRDFAATLLEINYILFEFDDLSCGCDEVLASAFKKIFDIDNRLILALVAFIFKAGDPSLLTNYRPILSLNVISKLIEKLVYRRTLKFNP